MVNYVQQSHSAFYTGFSPTDSTSYHYQNITSGLFTPPAQWERTNAKWGKAMTLIEATAQVYVTGVGTGETSTLSIDDSSDTVIVELFSNIRADLTYSAYSWTGSVAIDPDEAYRFMLDTPAWITNPTGVYITTTLIFTI